MAKTTSTSKTGSTKKTASTKKKAAVKKAAPATAAKKERASPSKLAVSFAADKVDDLPAQLEKELRDLNRHGTGKTVSCAVFAQDEDALVDINVHESACDAFKTLHGDEYRVVKDKPHKGKRKSAVDV